MKDTRQKLTDAIVRINETMEDVGMESLDYQLLAYMAAALGKHGELEEAAEWAEGFNTYLRTV